MDSIKETYEQYMKSEERKKTLENAPVEFTVDSDGKPVLLSDADNKPDSQ